MIGSYICYRYNQLSRRSVNHSVIFIQLTGRWQLAQVTARQSGQTCRFCRGFAMKPEEHWKISFIIVGMQRTVTASVT